MIIRVLFLGVGAALRDGLAEPQVSLVVLHPFASKEMSEGRGGGPDRGVLSENLAEPFPSELQPTLC